MAALVAPARPSLLACLPSLGSPRAEADTRVPPRVWVRTRSGYVRAGERTRACTHRAAVPRRRPPARRWSKPGARAPRYTFLCACARARAIARYPCACVSVCTTVCLRVIARARVCARARRSIDAPENTDELTRTHAPLAPAHVSARRTAEREGTLNVRIDAG